MIMVTSPIGSMFSVACWYLPSAVVAEVMSTTGRPSTVISMDMR